MVAHWLCLTSSKRRHGERRRGESERAWENPTLYSQGECVRVCVYGKENNPATPGALAGESLPRKVTIPLLQLLSKEITFSSSMQTMTLINKLFHGDGISTCNWLSLVSIPVWVFPF